MPGTGGVTLRDKANHELLARAVAVQVMTRKRAGGATRRNVNAPTRRPKGLQTSVNAALHVQTVTLTPRRANTGESPPVETRQLRARRRRLVADNIRRCRRARGLSQDRLAEIIGVPRDQMNKWENARWEPTAVNLLRIAKALEVTVEDLYDESSDAETAA